MALRQGQIYESRYVDGFAFWEALDMLDGKDGRG